ncbi:hypothetical protein RND61_05255 [Streptomyces sp. TRM76323]|uniref:Uncharacterized protein n=1 Tax=Streptomyces tamarix TaxID=3078565 RepID=A0ABU3QFF1_9ACTN|nr:hypothetical protein [Streptomyces tamarix]MDT9681482.1 hypothetical protein [Streptomyces tamarix]
MPSPSRPHGRLRPAAARISAAVRLLVGEPDVPGRAAEYQRLLVQWSEVARVDVVKAA